MSSSVPTPTPTVPPHTPQTHRYCVSQQAGFGWGELATDTKAPKTKHPERGPAQGSPGLRLAPWEGKLLNREECRVKAETRGSWGDDNWASEGTTPRGSGLQTCQQMAALCGEGGRGHTQHKMHTQLVAATRAGLGLTRTPGRTPSH